MKKEFRSFIVGIFFLIFLLQNAHAISSDFKDSYAPKETMLGQLSGNILQPIDSSQIHIRRGYVSIATDYGIVNLDGTYYIWAVAPANADNYTLNVENIFTTVDGNTEIVDYEKKNTVAGNVVDYTVTPGVIESSQDFSIDVEAHNESVKSIDVNFPTQRTIQIFGKSQIDFSIANIVGTQFMKINVGHYSVPALIHGSATNGSVCGNGVVENGEQCESLLNSTIMCASLNSTWGNKNISCFSVGEQYPCQWNVTSCGQGIIVAQNNNQTNSSQQTNIPPTSTQTFEFGPKAIISVEKVGNAPRYSIFLKNTGTTTMNRVALLYNPLLFSVSPTGNISIAPNSTMTFNLTLTNTSRATKGVITANVNGKKQYLLIDVKFTTEDENVSIIYLKENSNVSSRYYCAELNGIVCNSGETCNGNNASAIEKNCCVGKCSSVSSGGGYSWIGYLIAAIIIIVLVVVYMKYKKVKPGANPLAKAV